MVLELALLLKFLVIVFIVVVVVVFIVVGLVALSSLVALTVDGMIFIFVVTLIIQVIVLTLVVRVPDLCFVDLNSWYSSLRWLTSVWLTSLSCLVLTLAWSGSLVHSEESEP